MPLLDGYYAFVDDECKKLMDKNLSLEGFLEASGLGKLAAICTGTVNETQLALLKNTPIFALGEDWLAEQVTNASSNIVNNLTAQLEDVGGAALSKARDVAFNAITTAMSLQQQVVFYFAMKSAENCVLAIDENIEILIPLRDAIRRLYNALVALSATGDFMTEYLNKLRNAIIELVSAYNKLQRVSSGFKSTDRFQSNLYAECKVHVDTAGKLILPEPVKPDYSFGTRTNLAKPNTVAAKKLNFNKLLPSELGIQTINERETLALQAMAEIPKLTWEVLTSYNFSAAKTLKINSILIGLASITAPSNTMPTFLKNYILKSLQVSIDECLAIIKDMSDKVNGSETSFDVIMEGFTPAATSICARTPLWGIRVKGLQVLLETIDTKSLDMQDSSNELVNIYNTMQTSLKALKDLKGSRTIYLRTDGREEIGQLEPTLIKLASNAVLAIVDKTQLAKNSQGLYKEDTVIVLARNAMEFIDLSLQSHNEVKAILNNYIALTKPKLGMLSNLGDSILDLCDELGLDKMKDELLKGKGLRDDITKLSATYAGAALAGLYSVRALLSDSSSVMCLEEVINEVKVADRAKQLESARSPATSAQKQIEQNKETCAELRRKKKKNEQCINSDLNLVEGKTEALGIGDQLMGIFKGLLGDDMAPTTLTPTPPGYMVSDTPLITTFASDTIT